MLQRHTRQPWRVQAWHVRCDPLSVHTSLIVAAVIHTQHTAMLDQLWARRLTPNPSRHHHHTQPVSTQLPLTVMMMMVVVVVVAYRDV